MENNHDNECIGHWHCNCRVQLKKPENEITHQSTQANHGEWEKDERNGKKNGK